MIFLVYFVFIKAPSLESLHTRAKELIEEEQYTEALREPLSRFKTHYKDSKDSLAIELKSLTNLAMMKEREIQLHNRFESPLIKQPEGPAESWAWDALEAEKKGNLDEAEKFWKKLESLAVDWHTLAKGDVDVLDRHAWGLVGAEYRQQIKEAREELEDLNDNVKNGKEPQGKSAEEKIAIKALQVQKDNKKEAKDLWNKLKDRTERNYDQRKWYLMATSCLRKLDEEKDKNKK